MKETVDSLGKQLLEVKQQLKSQEQQFRTVLDAVDKTKQPSPTADVEILSQIMAKLEAMTGRLTENQQELRRHIDISIGEVKTRICRCDEDNHIYQGRLDALTNYIQETEGATATRPSTTTSEIHKSNEAIAETATGARQRVQIRTPTAHDTMINVRRASMGFSSTPAARTSRPLPNFNATRLIQAADQKLPGTTTFNNDPSYVGAIDSSNGTPPPEAARTRLADRFPDTEAQPMSTLFSELISTLKMTGVAPIALQPLDGTHLKYPLFNRQFYAMYHN